MQEGRLEKKRAIWLAAGLLLVLVYLGGRLGSYHLCDYSRSPNEATRDLLGIRGTIYDCNGSQIQMAVSLPAWQFYIDRHQINRKHKPELIIDTVADMLDVPREEVASRVFGTSSWGEKPLGVSSDQFVHETLVKAPKLISGVRAHDIAVRTYPHGRRMAHVIGFVNKEGVGSSGVEQRFENHLRGTPGIAKNKKDGRGREVRTPESTTVQPIPGSNVHLTLDHNIQYVVEQALAEVVDQFQAESAWSIVQEVKTGKILAMATFPDFDPGNYNDVAKEVWRNHAVSMVYEPGSIMKAVSVSAALNERLVTPNTLVDAENGVFMYAGKPLRDHITGRITVSRALAASSNIVCAKLGLMLGSQRLDAYLRGFGFGNTLGIDLPGEERGLIGNWKSWDKLKPTRVPIGQGVAVTGLQMVNAYSTIANGGKLMKPYVVDRIISAEGQTVFQAQPEVLGSPIRPEVAQAVREMLIGVTEAGGTGKRADVKGYSVAGKTGTAQHAIPKAKGGGYSNTDYFASFVGFVPAREPVFCVLVSVDRPRPQHTGGYVAAPVFAKIAAATALYLEVPPDIPE